MEHQVNPGIQEKRPSKNGSWRKHVGSLLAASFLIALLIGSFAFFSHSPLGQPSERPAVMPWELQHDQTVVQNHEGLFEMKYIWITTEFRIFYVAHSKNRDGLTVQAVSISPTGTSTPLATTIQPLGHLGIFDAGVLHVKLLHITGQVIELHITPQGAGEPTWKLAPLKQTLYESRKDSQYGLSIQVQQPSGVLWFGPVKGETVAFFKESETKPDASYVFVRFDDITLVKVITQAEYLKIAGKENFR